MGKDTEIAWTDATWNPWQGCDRVSAGCKFCYADRDMSRWGLSFSKVHRSAKRTFELPLRLQAEKKVFTCSWSDFFHPDADLWRKDAWEIIKARPDLSFQILTKRVERVEACLPDDWTPERYANVWLGVSIEEQRVYHRAHTLAKIPAKVRFISAEPLIGPLDMGLGKSHIEDDDPYWPIPHDTLLPYVRKYRLADRIDWVIIGGESGKKHPPQAARTMDLDWAREIISQCHRYGVAVFVKQLGTQHATWRSRHGTDTKDWPEDLIIQNFPK